jgi:LPXTG-site transpeptidase (sortase) family protein
MNAATMTVGLIQAVQNAYSRKWSFLAAFVLVFVLTLRICMITGFIPNPVNFEVPTLHGFTPSGAPQLPIQTSPLTASVGANDAAEVAAHPAPSDGSLNMSGELPTKISIPAIGLSATISNPATTNIEKLDQNLLSGAVRYPTSATLGQNGNVVLFGHSSYLPVVINQAFKTFDGIQKLKAGDEITVQSDAHAYTYAVTGVQKENVASDQGIPLATHDATLTLATCNSFGQKTDRFVVTAKLVRSSALGS